MEDGRCGFARLLNQLLKRNKEKEAKIVYLSEDSEVEDDVEEELDSLEGIVQLLYKGSESARQAEFIDAEEDFGESKKIEEADAIEGKKGFRPGH